MEATVTATPKRDRKSYFNNVEIEVMLEMLFKNSKTITSKVLPIITQRTKNHTPRFAMSTKAALSATCCRVGRSRMTVRWSARRRSVTDRLYQNDKHLVIAYMSNGFVRSRNILSRRKNRRQSNRNRNATVVPLVD